MEAPEFYVGGYFHGGPTPEFLHKKRILEQKPAAGDAHFAVDDLLDFPNDDGMDHDAIIDDGLFQSIAKNCTITATTTTTDSSNSSSVSAGIVSSQSFADSHFSGDLCVPYDDLAELEWLSNFVEDSFSTGQNLHTELHMLSGPKPATASEYSSSETYPDPVTRNNPNKLMFQSDTPLPGKARSKRSRAGPCDWTTRLLHTTSPTGARVHPKKERNPNPSVNSGSDAPVRKCLHCAAEKTPQWRTGPMGPKTLCNACGVRYKSGRLVPEYRPSSSPTFVPTKHSNSHRKVLELRRQKEMHRAQQEQFLNQRSIFGGGEDFLIHHHSGPNFRHVM